MDTSDTTVVSTAPKPEPKPRRDRLVLRLVRAENQRDDLRARLRDLDRLIRGLRFELGGGGEGKR